MQMNHLDINADVNNTIPSNIVKFSCKIHTEASIECHGLFGVLNRREKALNLFKAVGDKWIDVMGPFKKLQR